MNVPDKALEAAVQALFDDGCGEPKVDAATVLEAAYKFIVAQTLRAEAQRELGIDGLDDPYVHDWLTREKLIARADELDPL